MRSFLFQPRHSALRWLLVPALLVAAAAHLPVLREHLQEAPYMGILFIVLASACVFLAAALISLDSSVLYALAVLTCTLAVVGYALTRLIAFPQLSDDVGNWAEPLGLVSIASETAAAIVAVVALRRPRSVAPVAAAPSVLPPVAA